MKLFRNNKKKINIHEEVSKALKCFPKEWQTGQWRLFFSGKLTAEIFKLKRTLGFELE